MVWAPRRGSSKIGGTLLHPSLFSGTRGGGRQRANLELYAEDRPPVPGGKPSGEGSRAAGTAKR